MQTCSMGDDSGRAYARTAIMKALRRCQVSRYTDLSNATGLHYASPSNRSWADEGTTGVRMVVGKRQRPIKRRVVRMKAGPGQWTQPAFQLQSRAFLAYGRDFLRVGVKAGPPVVRAFLLGQALELFLKSFLLANGLRTTELAKRPYSHNLERLLSEAKSRGLEYVAKPSPGAATDIGLLNVVYKGKDLQYFSLLHLLEPLQLPRLDRITRYVRRLERELPRGM